MVTSAKPSAPSVLVIHGPNLNLLGTREPAVYGHMTLSELDDALGSTAGKLRLGLETAQANSEGSIIDLIHVAPRRHQALVINPGGYTHTSVAIHDALRAVDLPTIEVHLSNLYARSAKRHESVTAPACSGVIMGFGPDSYHLALHRLARFLYV